MVYVRRNIWDFGRDDPMVTAYANAVRQMQTLPANNPLSWIYQAAIHGTYLNDPLSAWNQCRHGSWYFLSWHRMYVYFFESIVRKIIVQQGGPSDWALFYWDYHREGQNSIPPAFRGPVLADGLPNPLYVTQRAPGINAGAGLPAQVTDPSFALSRTLFTGVREFGGGVSDQNKRFWSATGRLEQSPHNDVHNAVGGPTGWMSDPQTAAQDPIFWLHHANIDRLWWLWQNLPGRSNPNDANWLNRSFPFCDINGNPVTIAAFQIQNIVTQLNYDYDTLFPKTQPAMTVDLTKESIWPQPWPRITASKAFRAIPEVRMTELLGATANPVVLDRDTVEISLRLDERALGRTVSLIEKDRLSQKVLLDLEDLSAEGNAGSVYSVYLNAPEDKNIDKRLYHIGNVSLFGKNDSREPAANEHHNAYISIDITEFLDDQATKGVWQTGNEIKLSFEKQELLFPEGYEERTSEEEVSPPPITIGRVSIKCL
jgi:tyrosinase